MLQGSKIDTLNVPFDTNATIYDTAPTQSDISDKVTGVGNATDSTSTTCAQECALYSLLCAAEHKCWARIGLFFAYIGIAILAGMPSMLLITTFAIPHTLLAAK